MKSNLTLLIVFFLLSLGLFQHTSMAQSMSDIAIPSNQVNLTTDLVTDPILHSPNAADESGKSDSKFNLYDTFLQSAGGYLISGVLGITAMLVVSKTTTNHPYNLVPLVTLVGVFSQTAPLTVYLIGEKLTDTEKVKTSLFYTYVGGEVLTFTTFGILTPVGASLAYQWSKKEKVENKEIEK